MFAHIEQRQKVNELEAGLQRPKGNKVTKPPFLVPENKKL